MSRFRPLHALYWKHKEGIDVYASGSLQSVDVDHVESEYYKMIKEKLEEAYITDYFDETPLEYGKGTKLYRKMSCHQGEHKGKGFSIELIRTEE